MNKIIASALALALSAGVAQAASLTNKSYKTARQAALAGAAYRLDKAAGYGRFSASDLKISRAIDAKGPSQKFEVVSKAKNYNGKPLKKLTMTIKKDAPGKYRAFIPNRNVYTPVYVGNNGY